MKLAVLADVHANLEALESVLADLGRWPDQIVVAGDLVGYGPDPNAVIARLRECGARCVAGNHEAMVLRRLRLRRCNYAGIRAVLWTRTVLQPENRSWLEALPPRVEVAPDIVVVHADPNDIEKYLRSESDARAALAAAGPGVRLLVTGHTHQPMLWNDGLWSRAETGPRPLGQRVLLNPGAVGQSRDERCVARYARVDLDAGTATFRELEYPWQVTAGKMTAAGLVPFLKKSPEGPATRLNHALQTRWLRLTAN